MPSISIFFPVCGHAERDRMIHIIVCKNRLWNEHLSDPSSHWVFIYGMTIRQIVTRSL